MAQPMLQITASTANEAGVAAQVTPHLLPCRIHHTGPVGDAQLWRPTVQGTESTAYFRGRKLCGRTIRVPEGYRGVVGVREASAREQAAQRNETFAEVVDVDADADEQAAAQQQAATGGLAVLGEFDEMVVWGHQNAPDAATDAYMRGMDEWLSLAEQAHSYSRDDKST